MQLLAVTLGGALGALGRFWLVDLVNMWMGRSFPWGTLSVNVLGSLLIGVFYVLIAEKALIAESLKPFLITGLLGAFTTFSAFSLDMVNLIERGEITSALIYGVASVLVCLFATFISIYLIRSLI